MAPRGFQEFKGLGFGDKALRAAGLGFRVEGLRVRVLGRLPLRLSFQYS